MLRLARNFVLVLLGLILFSAAGLAVFITLDSRIPTPSRPPALAQPTPATLLPLPTPYAPGVRLEPAPELLPTPTSIPLADLRPPAPRQVAAPFVSDENRQQAHFDRTVSQMRGQHIQSLQNQPPVPIILQPGSDQPGYRLNRSRVNESFNHRSAERKDLQNRSPHSFHSVQAAPCSLDTAPFIGNSNSMIYHSRFSDWAAETYPEHRVPFCTEQAAIAAGYRASRAWH